MISGAVLTQKYKNLHGPEITPRPNLARPEPDSIVFTAHLIYYLLSSVHSSKIIPCTLSDHSALSLQIKLPSASQRGSAYWHFNNSLLSDNSYKEIIKNFWANWQHYKINFPDLTSWWDLGKSHIKSMTQKYSQQIAKERREVISHLNNFFFNLQSAPDLTPQAKEILKEQKTMLNEHLKNKAQGALIRSRFQHLNETDPCTSLLQPGTKTTQSINPFLKFVSPQESSPKTQQKSKPMFTPFIKTYTGCPHNKYTEIERAECPLCNGIQLVMLLTQMSEQIRQMLRVLKAGL